MAQYMVLGTGERAKWRLPDNTDVAHVRESVRDAMRHGDQVEVDVVDLKGDSSGTLLLNGKVLPFAAFVEMPENDVSESGW
jgi:hypothetical protein